MAFRCLYKYKIFLEALDEYTYDIGDTGICLYNKNELIERNETSEIQKDSPTTLMTGQDGDLGFYIQQNEEDKIFSLDLGALGSLDMDFEANNVRQLIETIEDGYFDR